MPTISLTYIVVLSHAEYNQTKNYNGYPVPAYYAWIDNPLSFFHVYYPRASDGSCDGYVLTSEVAAQEKCLHATNGGPFIMNKTPPGTLPMSDTLIIKPFLPPLPPIPQSNIQEIVLLFSGVFVRVTH